MSETGTYRTDIPAALNNKFQIPEKKPPGGFFVPTIQTHFDTLRRAAAISAPPKYQRNWRACQAGFALDCSMIAVHAPV
jgi:hypothetical protein